MNCSHCIRAIVRMRSSTDKLLSAHDMNIRWCYKILCDVTNSGQISQDMKKNNSHAVEDQVVALLHVFLGGVDDLFAGIVEGGECFVEGEIHPDCYWDKMIVTMDGGRSAVSMEEIQILWPSDALRVNKWTVAFKME